MKKMIFNLKLLLLPVLAAAALLALPGGNVFAASAVQVVAVSYTDESILVLNNGNSKIYYATELDASKNKWEVLPTRPASSVPAGIDRISVIDISWLSSNTENIIKIKGDGDDAVQVRVIVKARPSKLAVSINYSDLETLADEDRIGSLLNIMATEGTGVEPLTFDELQWSKGDSERWLSTELLTKRLLESYLVKGVDLYFRIAPKDDVAKAGALDLSGAASMFAYTNPVFHIETDTNHDGMIDSISNHNANSITFSAYPDGTNGRRASNAVKLKIAKQTALPVIGVDGSKFKINIKYGQEYRVTVGATTTNWTKVTDRQIKTLTLSAILKGIGTYDGLTAASAFPDMKVEIRGYATAKAAATKITETKLTAQRKVTGAIKEEEAPASAASDDPNLYITYNGTKNINVTIPSASAGQPYEYTVVKKDAVFDINKAAWTSISKSATVKITSSKAVDYGTLYIRKKEIKYKAKTSSSEAIAFQMASTYVTFPIRYPSVPEVDKTTLEFVKNYSNESDVTFTVKLNSAGKQPFETKLKAIRLGTREVPVSSAEVTPAIPDGTLPNASQEYTMKIVLNKTELEKMPNCTAKALSIYYENGTVDKTSVRLTIKSPTAAMGLTVTLAPGTAPGTTAPSVVNAPGTDNTFVYKISADEVKGVNTEDVLTDGISFTSGADITITADSYITIYEINSTTKKVVKYKSVKVTADKIAP